MQYKKLGRTGLSVSRLGLGTAEIGFAYGIGPRVVPTDKEADRLLKSAVDMGINFFDTAHIHQLADERIAKSGIAKIPGVIIASKCAHFLEKGEDPPPSGLEKIIRSEVEDNLRNLKIDSLTVLQLHGGSNEQIKRGDLIAVLSKLRDEGKIRFVGISVRGLEPAWAAVESGFFDVINFAGSLFDQRMYKAVIPTAYMKKIGVINRSVLLKGALTPAIEYLSDQLGELKINCKLVEEAAKKLGLSLPALAVQFVLSNKHISTVLVGTSRLQHLSMAVEVEKLEPLSVLESFRLEKLAITDENQIDPARWPKN